MNELFSVNEIRGCAMKTFCMTYRHMCDIVKNYSDVYDSYSSELSRICKKLNELF